MSLRTLSFPTQPSPSQPNPPVKPCMRYGLRAAVGGLVTNHPLEASGMSQQHLATPAPVAAWTQVQVAPGFQKPVFDPMR